MVENRHQSGEEDDHRQCTEREGVGERIGLVGSEQELGALIGIGQQRRDAAGHPLDHRAPAAGGQHQERHQRLQREGGAHHPQPDPPLADREQEGDREDHHDADETGNDRVHGEPSGKGNCG